MGTVFFLLIIVIAGIVILAFLKPKRGIEDEIWPFYAKKPLSQPEQILYFRLIQALPEHIILAQVQLSRLLGVKKGQAIRSWILDTASFGPPTTMTWASLPMARKCSWALMPPPAPARGSGRPGWWAAGPGGCAGW